MRVCVCVCTHSLDQQLHILAIHQSPSHGPPSIRSLKCIFQLIFSMLTDLINKTTHAY